MKTFLEEVKERIKNLPKEEQEWFLRKAKKIDRYVEKTDKNVKG